LAFKKHITLTISFILLGTFSIAQTFMVLEKMGTKKRYLYYVGQQIEYQLEDQKSYDRSILTNILDSAFVINSDTIEFSTINSVNIRNKREPNIISAAGPVLISAGVVLLAIDAINRGIVQEGGYTWDSSIGTTSAILVTAGALILILKKNKISLKEKGWWRLRKVAIY
jgi:hypothetical protein